MYCVAAVVAGWSYYFHFSVSWSPVFHGTSNRGRTIGSYSVWNSLPFNIMILILHTLSVAFLKLTAFSWPLAPPSASPKCLRFGHILHYKYSHTYLHFFGYPVFAIFTAKFFIVNYSSPLARYVPNVAKRSAWHQHIICSVYYTGYRCASASIPKLPHLFIGRCPEILRHT